MKTADDFQTEYERLYCWRELWSKLANRKPKTWRGTLQTRQERVERRAWLVNCKISNLMREYDREILGK